MSKRTTGVCFIGFGVLLLVAQTICAANMAHVGEYGARLIRSRSLQIPECIGWVSFLCFSVGACYIYAEEVGSRWNRALKWMGGTLISLALIIAIVSLIGSCCENQKRSTSSINPTAPKQTGSFDPDAYLATGNKP